MIITLLIILNLIIYLKLKSFSKIINIYDKPDKKIKLHKGNIPLLGGVILFMNILIFIVYQLFFSENLLMLEKSLFNNRDIYILIFFIISFFLIGLYDDKFKINPSIRLILITISSIIILLVEKDLIITKFSLSFYPNKIFLNEFSFFFTIFCIIILINSLNFYDGINCQSGIFYLIVFSYLFVVSDKNFFYLFLISIIIFCLFLNLKRKLFFGDSGVYLISALIITSLIYEHNLNRNIIYADEIFILLLMPGLDLVRLTLQRLISFKNVFTGDRDHFHHLLIRKYNLLHSNIILFFFNIFPLLFLINGFNFYYVFASTLIVYFYLIIYLKKKN